VREYGSIIEIPVHYNGEDLDFLAQWLDVSPAEIVERHTSSVYQAAFAGFAPGFVYLTGGHPSFDKVPRRASPRTRVSAGSVALAGHFSAIYPKDGPGGWQLIGTTPLLVWDLARPEPALIRQGQQVRFIDAAGSRATVILPTSTSASAPASAASRTTENDIPPAQTAFAGLHVVSPGIQTLFQDEGRIGQGDRGISRSGALDRRSFHEVNRRVGNPMECPVLENAMGHLKLRAAGPCVVCVGGADVPIDVVTPEGQRLRQACNQPIALDEGDCLQLGAAAGGVRSYIAVRGGWLVSPVLQSCAYDTLAGIGPTPLKKGDVLRIGSVAPGQLRAVEWDGMEPLPSPALPRVGDCVTLDLVLGPRDDWFTPQALQTLAEQTWQVTAQSNRIGLRLAGAEPLDRSSHYVGQELPSEGTVAGALQVPADGQPILFLADHPLTGGYPVIGCIASHHLDLLGQIPAGASIRLNPVRPDVIA
jgi:biotin-dependent carboxylase-like uncharacterized protein